MENIVTLTDKYDFTEWRSHSDPQYTWLSVEANNLGYTLQRDGYGTEYTYVVDFDMDIEL